MAVESLYVEPEKDLTEPEWPALECLDVFKIYRSGPVETVALRGLDLRVERDEMVAVLGPSGCGKSTLLALAAGLDQPSAGELRSLGRSLGRLDEEELAAYRARDTAIVFQSENLWQALTARENVATSLRLAGLPDADDAAHFEALCDAGFTVRRGESVAVWGRSGSGRTTILHVLGGLAAPTSGTVKWRGQPLSTLDVAARAQARRDGIAYVFHGSNLLPHFTAYENVAFTGSDHAEGLLALVGLRDKLDALPSELSGGEQQRVAIARALGQEPDLLLCHEPTGHLDSDTGARVLDLIYALKDRFGFALVTATHDMNVAARAERTIRLADGEVVDRKAMAA